MRLPLGWHTDLAVQRLSGATITDHSDHLVVRTPSESSYHWGNFVLVTDPAAVDDAGRWVAVFEDEFPAAQHRAVGLVAEPTNRIAWAAAGLTLEHEDVLATGTGPERRPLAEGYRVRDIVSDDEWAQHSTPGGDAAPEHLEFSRRRGRVQRGLVERGEAAFFGAFTGEELVASLGIVDCGEGVFRYQDVETEEQHRRRGLAGHLLGVAADWAADRGARQWVIIADADSDASRLYQGVGFEPIVRSCQAYRSPDRELVPAVGAVVVDDQGRVLLVLRGHEPEPGRWTIPGGKVEQGESLAQALVREVREETGLDVEVHEELWTLTKPVDDERDYEIHDFRASVVGGELRPGDDAPDVRWFAPDDLASVPLTQDLPAWLQHAGVLQR